MTRMKRVLRFGAMDIVLWIEEGKWVKGRGKGWGRILGCTTCSSHTTLNCQTPHLSAYNYNIHIQSFNTYPDRG
jgi:hypothetical protein